MPQKIAVIILKFELIFCSVMDPKEAYGIANSVDLDQEQSEPLHAKTCLWGFSTR